MGHPNVPSYIIILNLYHFLYHQKAVLLWKLLILTRCSFCRRAMGQCCSRGRPAKDEKKTGEEEDGGQGEGRRRRTEGWANIFAHPYFFKELGFLCIYNFTKIFLQHYLHKEQTFFASTFLQRFSRIYIFTRIYNFSCICIFTRSKDFYSQGAKKEPFWWNCVWNMWSQAESFSCRKFLRQYCCHWKFTILYQERLTDSLNMIRD